jgi:hypothetical protein
MQALSSVNKPAKGDEMHREDKDEGYFPYFGVAAALNQGGACQIPGFE